MKGRGPRPLDEGDTGHLQTSLNGGAKRDRTADLNTASVALSQLSYSPIKRMRIINIYDNLVKYFYHQFKISSLGDYSPLYMQPEVHVSQTSISDSWGNFGFNSFHIQITKFSLVGFSKPST